MRNPFRKPVIFLFLAMALLAALPVYAQNRIIRGKVTNEKDEPIEKANITIMGMDIKREYKVKTDKKGEYFYMGIPSGVYRVVVRAQGYEPDFQQNVRPALGDETTVNFKLQPGDMNRKLAYELTPEEVDKIKAEMAKAEERKKSTGEVKEAFDAGLALAQQGKYAEAVVEYNKALEKDPDQAYIQANLADALAKMDKNEEALAAYQKAIALKPDDPAMYTNMGVLLGKMGKTEESQAMFKKAAEISPASAAQNFYNLGATLVNSGKSAEAAAAFRQAIQADPSYAEAWYQLGICLSGDPATMPEAVKALQKYIEIGKSMEQIEVAKQLISALQPQIKK
jgi:tetratricopeptide (TPR) repeat protein